MNRKDGGPVAPWTELVGVDYYGEQKQEHPGLTIRQLYIAHALQGLCANTNVLSTEVNEDEVTAIAGCAVAIADRALEAERINDEAEAAEEMEVAKK